MDNNEFWTNFTALLPNGIETTPRGEECLVKWNDKELNIVRNDNSFVINGKVLQFEDNSEDIINTFLIPYVLQELDGQRRI